MSMRRSGWWRALAALFVGVTTAGAQTSPVPAVRVLLNQTAFQPGATLQLGAEVTNPGGGPLADFYLGIQLPDGVNTVTVRLGAGAAAGTLANLASLTPTATGINLAGAFAVREPALLAYTFTGVEPLGTYTAYLAAVVTGGLRDGALGPGELLAFTTTSFTFGAGGILLTGDPVAPAVGATSDYSGTTGVAEAQISTDAAGRETARTQIEIAFRPDATVGQVNTALTAIDGRIVSMLRGVLILLVEIPDPGSIAGLDAVAARVRAFPGVRDVRPQHFYATEVLPSNYTPTSSDLDKIDHLIAVRTPAAWNTAAALALPAATRPTFIVADNFGGGSPGAPFDVSDVPGDFATGRLDRHGYHVLGIIAATQGGNTSNTGLVTGLLPGRTAVRVVDQRRRRPAGDVQNGILTLVRTLTGNIVVNTSLGFSCGTAAQAAVNCTAANAVSEAASWLEKIRGTADRAVAGAGLERRFLHAASGGNTDASGRDSRTSSAFAAAALRTDIVSNDGVALPAATNTLVVEDHVTLPGTVVSRGCLSPGSKRVSPRSAATNLANVSAVGTDVWSMTNASTTAGNLSGTSMATPQAAALAGWVWALRPSLTPAQVRTIITDTAVDLSAGCAPDDVPAPSLDVYAAVLGTDIATNDAPVRLTLLDVASPGAATPDGVFADDDLVRFAQAFAAVTGTPTYSRFDLNGDGFTGAGQLTSFDLNFDRQLQTASYIAGGATVSLNERQLADIEILCFYAFSPLYAGTTAGRSAAIGSACGETAAPLRFPHGSQQMTVSVSALANGVTDAASTTRPNEPLGNVSASNGGASASVTNVVNQITTPVDVATQIQMSGVLGATLTAAGTGASAVADLRHQYDIDVPAGSSGTATFTVAFVGETGSIDVIGPNVNQRLRQQTGGTFNVTLQAGGRYSFFAGFVPLARDTTKPVSLTFTLNATVTP